MPFVSTAIKIGTGILGGLQIADLFGESGGPGPVQQQRLPGGAAPTLSLGPLGPTPAQGPATTAQTCAVPFRASQGASLRATPQVHALVNPFSGKLQWFGPGKIKFVPNRTRRRCCRPR